MSNTDNQVLDEDFISKVVGNDRQFRKELFELFLENSAITMGKLKKSLDENNNGDWYIYSHALKGSTASIGAFALSKIFNEAQNTASTIKIDVKSEIYSRALIEYDRLRDYLKGQLKNLG